MADRNLLFQMPMVRALIAGTKTQTRRPLNPQPQEDVGLALAENPVRFKVGDRIWVREAWRASYNHDLIPPRDIPPGSVVDYLADDKLRPREVGGKARPSMFMPRWASRITLHVTEVRVERLQSISEADARAEGVVKTGRFFGVAEADWDFASTLSAVDAYALLWDGINGEGAWDENPWIVATSFDVSLRNIDAPMEGDRLPGSG